MTVAVLVDPEASATRQVEWALWIAGARGEDAVLLLPPADSHAALHAKIRARIAADPDFEEKEKDKDKDKERAKEKAKAKDKVGDDAGPDGGDAPDDAGPPKRSCRIVAADPIDPSAILAAAREPNPSLFVVLAAQFDPKDERITRLGAEVLPSIACMAAVVRMGDGEAWPLRHLLAPASRGGHPRTALQFADALATAVDGKLSGAYVEPELGDDAEHAGRLVAGDVLRSALRERAAMVTRRIVVNDDVRAGLLAICDDARPDAVVLATPRLGLLDKTFFNTLPAQLVNRLGGLPVVVLREAMPIGNRAWRSCAGLIRRKVPQVEKDVRTRLTLRVYSSSAWNFDFVALLALSTAIASLGLLQNSGAVIIGAMLVAPLMTPIIGLGLALAQGNRALLKRACWTLLFGVSVAFALAFALGWIHLHCASGDFVTAEMRSRGSPRFPDLLVALVSGLAAAYAHSRKELDSFAALTGVAIAAALVPPIATAGLGLAAGELYLARGALALFATNMVTIALAASAVLLAVGIRVLQREHRWVRHIVAFLVLGLVGLVFFLLGREPPGTAIELPAIVEDRVRAGELAPGERLLGMTARNTETGIDVTVELGCTEPPPAATITARAASLRDYVDWLVEEDVERLELHYSLRAVDTSR